MCLRVYYCFFVWENKTRVSFLSKKTRSATFPVKSEQLFCFNNFFWQLEFLIAWPLWSPVVGFWIMYLTFCNRVKIGTWPMMSVLRHFNFFPHKQLFFGVLFEHEGKEHCRKKKCVTHVSRFCSKSIKTCTAYVLRYIFMFENNPILTN